MTGEGSEIDLGKAKAFLKQEDGNLVLTKHISGRMNGAYKIIYSVNGNTFNINLNIACNKFNDKVIPAFKTMDNIGTILIHFNPPL